MNRFIMTIPFACLACGGPVDSPIAYEDDAFPVDAPVTASLESDEGGTENETVPLLVDSFVPDPSTYFGESEEEQERAREAFGEDVFDGAVQKRVNTSSCLDFNVPPFSGDLDVFDNTLVEGGLTPRNTCGFRTMGESRRVRINNFSLITRPGDGNIAVGVRNATVAECVDLRVALAVAEYPGSNKRTRLLYRSGDVAAQLQVINGQAVCASYVPMFGTFESHRYEGKDLYIAAQATKNGQVINDRVHLIRTSDI